MDPASALNRRERVWSSVRFPKPNGSFPKSPIPGSLNVVTLFFLSLLQNTPVHEHGLCSVRFQRSERPPTATRRAKREALSEARSAPETMVKERRMRMGMC